MENIEIAEKLWSLGEICKLYLLDKSSKSAFHKARLKGSLPNYVKAKRGSIDSYLWKTKFLPEIGKNYGFLKPANELKVLCFHTSKGGTLKSTLAYITGRTLALNGISVCLVGVDIQGSLTQIALHKQNVDDINEVPDLAGLYEFMIGDQKLSEIIVETDLPTLHLIPENPRLSALQVEMQKGRGNREATILNKLVKPLRDLGKFDVIIFDTGPSFSLLTENALVATSKNGLISPLACDVGSYFVSDSNIDSILTFREEYTKAGGTIRWDYPIVVPTLLSSTKLSKQIHASFLNRYDWVSPNSIRRSVKGESDLYYGMTPFESYSNQSLLEDYYGLICEIWKGVEGKVIDRIKKD